MSEPSELSPETRTMLARGRHGHALTAGRRQRLKRAVLAHAAAGAVVATAANASARTILAAKILGVFVVVGAVAGGLRAVAPSRREARNDAVMSMTSPNAGASAGVPRAAPSLVVSVDPAGHLPSGTARSNAGSAPTAFIAATGAVIPMGAPPRPVLSAEPQLPADMPARTASGQAVASGPAPLSSVVTSAASTATVTYVPMTPSSPEQSSTQAGIAPQPAMRAPSLEAEAQLLREADNALKTGDPETCLRLLSDHATRFPNSVLEPERAAERVLALCRAGRVDDARGEARVFLEMHGQGPLASRVRSSCGGVGK